MYLRERATLAGTAHPRRRPRHRHGSGVEVDDQPRADPRRAGRRAGRRVLTDRRRTAQPRHRPDDRCAADPRFRRRRRRRRSDRGGLPQSRAIGPDRLRAGRHGAAVRAATGRARYPGGALRRRRSGPRPAHRPTARRPARPRGADRRHRAAVHGPRPRRRTGRHRTHRRLGVLPVRLRAAAVRGGAARGTDGGAHRNLGAVGPAYRDDRGDAGRSRSAGRRHGRQPVAGGAGPGGRPPTG